MLDVVRAAGGLRSEQLLSLVDVACPADPRRRTLALFDLRVDRDVGRVIAKTGDALGEEMGVESEGPEHERRCGRLMLERHAPVRDHP